MSKKSISLLLIYLLFQPIIMIVLGVIYLVNGGEDIESFMISDLVIGIILTILLIFTSYLIIKIKFNQKKVRLTIYLLAFLIGLSLSFILNYILKYQFNIVSINEMNIYMYFISSCILGPMTEEYLFRGLIYQELARKYSKRRSMILVTILFTLIHFNIYKMILAFIIGSLLIILVEKYQNIKVPIICHIGCNIMGFLFLTLL